MIQAVYRLVWTCYAVRSTQVFVAIQIIYVELSLDTKAKFQKYLQFRKINFLLRFYFSLTTPAAT